MAAKQVPIGFEEFVRDVNALVRTTRERLSTERVERAKNLEARRRLARTAIEESSRLSLTPAGQAQQQQTTAFLSVLDRKLERQQLSHNLVEDILLELSECARVIENANSHKLPDVAVKFWKIACAKVDEVNKPTFSGDDMLRFFVPAFQHVRNLNITPADFRHLDDNADIVGSQAADE